MGGRGRGGRGGRQTTTFTHDQLSALGLTGSAGRGEMLTGTVGPPPDFPMMANTPAQLKLDIKDEYLITIKRDIVARLRETAVSMAVNNDAKKAVINSNVNKYADILNGKPNNPMLDFPWHHVPAELRSNFKRKAINSVDKKAKQARIVDIESRLKVLEHLEKIKSEDVENVGGVEGNEEKEEPEGTEFIEEEQPDEEMDMETDYANDYFDNGEAFEDEDDQLDEPIF